MKEFTVKDMLTLDEIVTKTRLILRDRRNDEHIVVEIYHPGYKYPIQAMGHRIDSYGYEVLSCEAEKSLKGVIPWDDIYNLLARKEADYDRFEP